MPATAIWSMTAQADRRLEERMRWREACETRPEAKAPPEASEEEAAPEAEPTSAAAIQLTTAIGRALSSMGPPPPEALTPV